MGEGDGKLEHEQSVASGALSGLLPRPPSSQRRADKRLELFALVLAGLLHVA